MFQSLGSRRKEVSVWPVSESQAQSKRCLNPRTVFAQPPGGPVSKKCHASALEKLCQQLEITNYANIIENFDNTDPLENLSQGLAKDLRESEILTETEYKEAKFRWMKGSKFVNDKNAVIEEVEVLKTELGQLASQQYQTNASVLQNMTLAASRVNKITEARSKITKSLSILKKKLKIWKRQVTKRLSSLKNDPKEVHLEASNLGKPWWLAMNELKMKFDQGEVGKLKKHAGREVTMCGFNLDFYQCVQNLMYYHRVSGSECINIKEVMSVVKVPSSSTKRVISAMKEHLPVAIFYYYGQTILLDCETLNNDKSLLLKVISLQRTPPNKMLTNPKVPRDDWSTGKTIKKPRQMYHEKHLTVFQKVQNLIITGGVGGGEHSGIGADRRRRTELGMASINVPQILRQVKPLLAPGELLPSESTVRSWLTAPNKNRRYAKMYYKNLIPVKVPRKENTRPIGGDSHPDSHQAAGLVKFAREFSSLHSTHFNCWSNDDKVRFFK